jgi:hypothetical protein
MIKITGRPQFEVSLTLEQITLLMKIGSSHYDVICRTAVVFINGWHKQALQALDMELDTIIIISWNEMHTCIRILEIVAMLNSKERVIADQLFKDFLGARHQAEEFMDGWKTSYAPVSIK